MDTPANAAPDPAALGASMAHTMPPVTGAASPAAAPAAAPAPVAPASPEVDAKERPFDPAKFLPKKDKNGNWIPKSPGRYGKDGAKRPQPQAPSQATAEPDLFTKPGAASPPSASSSASPAPASRSSPGGGAGSYIPPESELPPSASTASPLGAGQAEAPEPVASAADAAEVACRALYSVVGGVTGAPEEAEAMGREHAQLRDVVAAYLKARGIETRGGWAVFVALLGWALRTFAKPKTRAWLAAQRKSEPTPATPIVDIEPRTPAPAPAASSPSSAPATERGTPAYSVSLARR